MNSTPHLIKKGSLFSMFCLSYLPLFLLISLRILFAKQEEFYMAELSWDNLKTFIQVFGFIAVLFFFKCLCNFWDLFDI